MRRVVAVATQTVAHLQVVMYTRKGCHLCERAWEELQRARRRYGFTLTAKDVDTDAALVKEYGNCVPVVAVNGKLRFRGVVNPVLLERLLQAETRQCP